MKQRLSLKLSHYVFLFFLALGASPNALYAQVSQQNMDKDWSGTATGTDTYSVTISKITASAPYNFQTIYVRFTNPNTGAATLRVTGATTTYSAIAITLNGSALVAGDIIAAATYILKYNSTTTKWELQPYVTPASNPAWSLTGNSGTTAGTNFVGTTDAVDLVLKSNSTERFRLSSGGNLGLPLAGTYSLQTGSNYTTTIGGNYLSSVLGTTYDTRLGAAYEVFGNTYTLNVSGAAVESYAQTYSVNAVGLHTIASPSLAINASSLLFSNAGTPGAGKLLQSDASGYATWQTIASPTTTCWSLTGNSGTTAGTNFVGTTDAVALVFKTNNTEYARINSTGEVGVGLTAASGHKLSSKSTTDNSSTFGLSVYNSASTALLAARSDGKVGVGTDSPQGKFEVVDNGGDGTWISSTGVSRINFKRTTADAISAGSLRYLASDNTVKWSLSTSLVVGADNLEFNAGALGNQMLIERATGSVVIATGSYSPAAKLHAISTGSTSATKGFLIEDVSQNDLFAIRSDGQIATTYSINASAGDAITIDKAAGSFVKDGTGTTFTLTNALITTSSQILFSVNTTGLTAGYDIAVVPGSGSAVFTFQTAGVAAAPSANCTISFFVIN